MATSSSAERRPAVGDVIAYSFLWSDQAYAGREEGAKARPCVIVLAVGPEPNPTLFVAPITSRDPADDRAIPLREGMAGLPRPSWIIPWELNVFIWPGPDLARAAHPAGAWWRLGTLAPGLRNLLADRIRDELVTRRLKQTPRPE